MTCVLATEQLTKVLDGKTVVDNVTLQIQQGSIFGIVGANGAGKTTLLRLLIGLYRPTSGQVVMFGETLSEEPSALRQCIHYVGADGDLYRSFRVEDLFTYAGMLYQNWDSNRAAILLDALGLPKKQSIRNLSVGMKVQLRLAVALSARPEVLVLDEPTNGLDPVVKRQFNQLIVQEAAGSGTTVIMATHLLDDLDRMADSVAVMYSGKLVASGMLDDLKSETRQIQCVLPEGLSELPEGILSSPHIVRHEIRGKMCTLVVEGDFIGLQTQLNDVGCPYIEVLDLGFDELFRSFMHKEGYERDGILLP